MLDRFLEQARADEPVYITDVRNAFQAEGKRPFHLQVTLYDGSERSFPLMLPELKNPEEEAFAASYIHATVYNILSSLGAVKIVVYVDTKDGGTMSLAKGLDEVFQTGSPKSGRFGYGKSLNVNERILAVLLKGKYSFAFEVNDISQEEPAAVKAKAPKAEPVFAALPGMAEDKMLLGIDIGGTDIKFTASINGKLAVYKEFDWFPAGFRRAEQLIEPVLTLTRLMRAAACVAAKGAAVDSAPLKKDATFEEMERGIASMEKEAGDALRNFDAIGLSFPDVVIQNLIVGGETFKTKGMRENTSLDYEKQFARISVLCDDLKAFVTENGAVMNTNDGPMAAFTAAVEMAAVGADVSNGFFAHTLGTELGTGWVLPDGSIPEIPLEVYNFIIDLGSFAQKEYDSGDVRSVNNVNTGLSGTLQKYTCQFGVWEGDSLVVPTEPRDMRKPCLGFFMKKAGEPGHAFCEEIFRQVGVYLAVTWEETQYILEPEAVDRTLFGRLVKTPVCFKLMCEGAARRQPGLKQYAADGSLANTSLMKQLEAHPEYTVAQFAQAVGAIYFGCLGLRN